MRFLLLSLLITSLSLQANEAVTSDYKTLLSNAHEYYQKKDYSQALHSYQSSYQKEPLDSTLYNIAICQYKLQQWQGALVNFKRLQTTQPESDLIKYNIAVIHKKLGNNEKAHNAFADLSLYAQDEQISMLADQQIDQISRGSAGTYKPLNKDASHWQSMFNVQLGNESNIILPDDENFTEQSDQFIDYMFATSWLSSQDLSNVWIFDFNYYGSQYNKATNYEVSMYNISGRKFFTPENLADTRFYIGADYESMDLDTDGYLDTFTVKLGARYNLSIDQKLLLDFYYKDISKGSDRFDYLAGNSTRLKLTWKKYLDNGYWNVGGKYYIDDKNDRYLEDEFISYSANRIGAFIARFWQYNQWDLVVQTEYRYSEYKDHNIYYGEKDTLREDDKYYFTANLTYNFTNQLSVNGEFDYTKNTSTLAENEYDQNTASLGITYTF